MSKPTTLAQLRAAAARAQGYAADVAGAAAEAIEEITPLSITATLSTTGWVKEEPAAGDGETEQTGDSDFPYYYDITDATITAADTADVHIIPSSVSAARACGFSTVVETLAGIIRVRAQLQPETAIGVQCSIQKGATQ